MIKHFKRYSRGICLALSLLITVGLCGNAKASGTLSMVNVKLAVSVGVNIYINDVPFTPTDVNGNEVKPFILSGTTYLPARAISNVFGAKIDWNGDTQSVYIDTSTVGAVTNNTPYRFDTVQTNTTLSAEKGVKIYVNNVLFTPTDVNGKAVAAYTVNGTTYLPVRAIASVFKTAIAWEASNSGVYIGTHTVLESPMEGYLLQGEAGYVRPDENGSIVELEARYMRIYNLLQKVNALVDEKQHSMADVSRTSLDHYIEYEEYLNNGNAWAQKYIDQDDALREELQAIIDSMEPGTQEKIVWGKYDSFAADIKAKSGSCSASLLGAAISAVEGATQKSLKRIGLFNESMAESYKAKFTAIYNAFLLEKASH